MATHSQLPLSSTEVKSESPLRALITLPEHIEVASEPEANPVSIPKRLRILDDAKLREQDLDHRQHEEIKDELLEEYVDQIMAQNNLDDYNAMLEQAFSKGREIALRRKLRETVMKGMAFERALKNFPGTSAAANYQQIQAAKEGKSLNSTSSPICEESSAPCLRMFSDPMEDLPAEAWKVINDLSISVLTATPTRPQLGVFYKIRPYVRTVSSAKSDTGTRKRVHFRDTTNLSYDPSASYKPVLLDKSREKVLQYVYEDSKEEHRRSGKMAGLSGKLFKLRSNKGTSAEEDRQPLTEEERERVLCCRITGARVKKSNRAPASANVGISFRKSIFFVNNEEEIVNDTIAVMYR